MDHRTKSIDQVHHHVESFTDPHQSSHHSQPNHRVQLHLSAVQLADLFDPAVRQRTATFVALESTDVCASGLSSNLASSPVDQQPSDFDHVIRSLRKKADDTGLEAN